MSLVIREIPSKDAPIDLLLLADPSVDKIHGYLSQSQCFIATLNGNTLGACLVQKTGKDSYELMSIAIEPEFQKRGYGTAMLVWVIEFFREAGARTLEVGTGTFGYQLAFYQRHGFRVTSIDADFFLNNYSEPIYENGIQLMDMLRLTLRYPPLPR